MNRTRWISGLTLLLLAATTQAQTLANGYNEWKKNDNQNRYECQYTYTNTKGKTSKQQVVVYPKGNPRAGWAYYYNKDGKPWARCAIKGNDKYNPKQMYWQQLNKAGDGYEDYKDSAKGFCPTPKDGKEAIPIFPDPPV